MSSLDREVLAAVAEYVVTSQKVIADLLEQKYSADQPRDWHGRFGEGTGAREEIQKPDFYKTDKGRVRGLALQQATLDGTLKKFGITSKTTGANLKAEYGRSLTNGGKAEGMVWYAQAAEKTVGEICKLNSPTGVYYTRAQAVAMVAATSPQNPWDDLPNSGKNADQRVYPNLALARACAEFVSENPVVNVTQEDADRFNSHPAWFKGDTQPNPMVAGQYQVHPDAASKLPQLSTDLVGHVILQPGFGLQGLPEGATKAINIASGASIDEELSGDKVRNFFTNLMNPGHGDAITVDTWMARIAVGKQVEGYYEAHPEELGVDKKGNQLDTGDMGKQAYLQLVGSHAGYEWVANQIRAQAKIANILPQQFQAATWVSARIESDKEKTAAREAARAAKVKK